MQLTIDTTKELSDIDLQILRLLTGDAISVECVPSKQSEFNLQPPDWLPEMDKSFTVHYEHVGMKVAGEVIPAPVSLPASPTPASEPETVSTATALSVEDKSKATDGDYLPRHLRDRLPELPTLAVDEDTDTAGVKWDATLHSESRAKCADGTWRKRRTAKNVIDQNAKLMMNTIVGAIAPPQPEITAEHVALMQTSVADIPPPPATVVIPPPPVAFTPVTTFRELMEKMTQHLASRAITSKTLDAICKEHGIESMQDCFNNTALIPSVHTAIEKCAVKGGV